MFENAITIAHHILSFGLLTCTVAPLTCPAGAQVARKGPPNCSQVHPGASKHVWEHMKYRINLLMIQHPTTLACRAL